MRTTSRGHPRRLALITPVLLLSVPALAFAQGRGDPAAMQERMNAEIDLVIEQLELTDDEAEVTRAILEEDARKRMAAMREMRSSGERPDRQVMQKTMQELDLATEEMLAAFLSEETMQAFREYREKRRAEARSRRGQGQRRQLGRGP